MGDVHPMGNPHYMLDPLNGKIVAAHICERLCQIDYTNCWIFLLIMPATRFCLKFMKTHQEVYDTELSLSVRQWLSIPAIVIGFVFLLLMNKKSLVP